MKFDFNKYNMRDGKFDKNKTAVTFFEFSKKARAVVHSMNVEYKNGDTHTSMDISLLIVNKFNKTINLNNPEQIAKIDLNELFKNLLALSYLYKTAPLFKDKKFKDKVAVLSSNIDSIANGEKASKTPEEILGPVDMQIAIELADKHYQKEKANQISDDYIEYDC